MHATYSSASSIEIQLSVPHLLEIHESIATMHRYLFKHFSFHVRLPTSTGRPKKTVITASEILESVASNELEQADQDLLMRTVRDAIVEFYSGYHYLDDAAKYHITYTPRYIQEGATSSNSIWWLGDPNDVAGEIGAVNYLRRKNSLLLGEFKNRQFDITPYLAKIDESIAFINAQWSLREQSEADRLLDRWLNSGFSQPTLTDAERARIKELQILPEHKFSNVSINESGNFAFARMMSGAKINTILQNADSRRLAHRAAEKILDRAMKSVISMIEPEEARQRISQASLSTVTSASMPLNRDWHPLSIVTTISSDKAPKLQLSDSVVVSTFASCAVTSYRILSFKASDRWSRLNSPLFRHNDLWFQEKDYLDNKIVNINILEGVDDPKPTQSYMRAPEFQKTLESHVQAHENCVLSVLGFAIAHELAHIYLSSDFRQLTAGNKAEIDADCAAKKVIFRLSKTKNIDFKKLNAFGKFRTFIEQNNEEDETRTVSKDFNVSEFIARMSPLQDDSQCIR